jgi:hypothetical protein
VIKLLLLTVTNPTYTNEMMLDLSNTEQEIILDPKVQIVNLEAAEQPEAFDLTPDKESDEADEAFVNRYLMTKSPVKETVKP